MIRRILQRANNLPFKNHSFNKNVIKCMSTDEQTMRDFINKIEKEKDEEESVLDDDTVNLGEEDQVESNKIQIIKPFSKCRRTQYHPKDILTLFKENYYQQTSYINFTIHLTADYIKKDQKVMGVYMPFKKLDINNVLCVITNEQNRKIVENNNAIFADETIIQRIKSEEVNYNKIIFTTDSLVLMDTKLKNILVKNNQIPNESLATLCKEEDLNKTLNDFNLGMMEFAMNKCNLIKSRVGLTKFTNKEVLFNLDRIIKGITEKKPKSLRAIKYFKRAFLSVQGGKSYEISLPFISVNSSSYFMNENIADEEHFVRIENVTKKGDFSDEDEFNLKI